MACHTTSSLTSVAAARQHAHHWRYTSHQQTRCSSPVVPAERPAAQRRQVGGCLPWHRCSAPVSCQHHYYRRRRKHSTGRTAAQVAVRLELQWAVVGTVRHYRGRYRTTAITFRAISKRREYKLFSHAGHTIQDARLMVKNLSVIGAATKCTLL